MKKAKKVLKVLGWVLAVVLVLLLALPLWIGPVVKTAANSIVPSKTGSDFRLNEFALNPYSGSLHVGDMHLENPPEFAKENCVELKSLDVSVDMSTVMTKKIRVKEIVVDGLLVSTTMTGSNFKKIASNATGPKSEGADKTVEQKKEEVVEKAVEPKDTTSSTATAQKKEETRVQIDRIVLRNLKVKIGMLPIPIPTIELTDIGADKEEGATFADVWQAIMATVTKSLGAIGDLGKNLFNSGAKATTTTVNAAADAAKATANAAADAASATINAASEAAEKTLKSVTDIFKKRNK